MLLGAESQWFDEMKQCTSSREMLQHILLQLTKGLLQLSKEMVPMHLPFVCYTSEH